MTMELEDLSEKVIGTWFAALKEKGLESLESIYQAIH